MKAGRLTYSMYWPPRVQLARWWASQR